MGSFFSDIRRRNLAILAGVALLAAIGAYAALSHRAAVVAPKYTPQTFFPGLAHRLNEVTRIRIVSRKGGAFELRFVPTKGWVLPGRANYPASFEQVRKTLIGLAALETVEPKTSRPEWLSYLDLDEPPKGGGLKITLSDEAGHTLAELIVGKTADIGDSGSVGLFVRKPGDSQSWLVSSPAEISGNQADWMDRQVMDVDRARVMSADVKPATGPAFKVSRAKPEDAEFTLSPLPKRRELAYPGAADGIAAAISGFTFDDIKPAGDIDFSKNVSRMVTKTFDGLVVTTLVVKQGEDYWARVFADAEPGKPEAARQARDISARAGGWAFKLEPYRGSVFTSTLESLLKPKK